MNGAVDSLQPHIPQLSKYQSTWKINALPYSSPVTALIGISRPKVLGTAGQINSSG